MLVLESSSSLQDESVTLSYRGKKQGTLNEGIDRGHIEWGIYKGTYPREHPHPHRVVTKDFI